MDKKIGLGRGLSALMGEDIPADTPVSEGAGITVLNLDVLEPSPYQPRRIFDDNCLVDLVASIKEKGVLQPLLVRRNPRNENFYEIIAGERRFRASKIAGLTEVPVIIKDFDDKTTLEVALIENLQREDLNPLEEAEGYRRLMGEFNYTQEALSKVVGKSRSYVANMMRLLDLSAHIKHLIDEKKLSVGHARALLNAQDPEKLAQQIIQKGLSVRQAEKLAVSEGGVAPRKKAPVEGAKPAKKDNDILVLENELTQLLKTPVSIKWAGNKGEVVISYASLDKLDVILQRLTMGGPVVE